MLRNYDGENRLKCEAKSKLRYNVTVQHALEVLEFSKIRALLSECCESPVAAQNAFLISPATTYEIVVRLRGETADAISLFERHSIPSLSAAKDLERPLQLTGKGGAISGSEIFEVGQLMSLMRALKVILGSLPPASLLHRYAIHLPEMVRLEAKINESFESDGFVRDAASDALAKARAKVRSFNQKISEKIQQYLSGPTRDYLSDTVVTQRNGRYVLPVRSEFRGKVRGLVHDTSASGQTVFVEPMEVVEMGNKLREAEGLVQSEIQRILIDFSSRIGGVAELILAGWVATIQLDEIFARARLAFKMDSSLPEIDTFTHISIEQGRHPLLDPKIAIPLSLELGNEIKSLLITGPNTGGKTVSMKTVGLFAAMAQCGMALPARSVRCGVFSQIFADIGDEQSLNQSLSTFSGHIKNIAEAMREVKEGALVLLDEVGAGTDPTEGASLAQAILARFQSKGALTMASSHFGELKLFAANTPGFLNCSMDFDLKSLKPTYRLLIGTPGSSHALKIAERYGLPADVIASAERDQTQDEQSINQLVEQLQQAQKRAQVAQSRADKLANRLKEIEREVEEKLELADSKIKSSKKSIGDAFESEMRKLRNEAQDLIDDLKKQKTLGLESARNQLKSIQISSQSLNESLVPKQKSLNTDHLVKGASVRILNLGQRGTIIEDASDGKVKVQVGVLRISLPIDEIELDQLIVSAPKKTAQKNITLQKQYSTSVEVMLVGLRGEDAENKLIKFLDDASLAGYDSIRIVHGKGEGILRKVTRHALKVHPGVTGYRDGEPSEGGSGVTIAILG